MPLRTNWNSCQLIKKKITKQKITLGVSSAWNRNEEQEKKATSNSLRQKVTEIASLVYHSELV